MDGTYGSWKILGRRASRRMGDKHIELPISFFEDGCGMAQFGRVPAQVDTLIMGMCLFDARWQVEFERTGGKGSRANPAPRRTLALPRDRNKAYDMLAKGRRVAKMYVPCTPGDYHIKLMAWQKQMIKVHKPKRVIYHLPVLEYLRYIADFQSAVGRQVYGLTDKLEEFALAIELELLEQLGDQFELLTFIRPMEQFGIDDPNASYLHPYVHFDQYGINPRTAVGVEDLVELRLCVMAQELTGVLIPMQCLMMGVPNPYMDKTLREGEHEEVYF